MRMGALKTHMGKSYQPVNEKEKLHTATHFLSAGNSFSPEKLQTPLNVVLTISPLFLLSTHLLANVSVGKAKILEVLPLLLTVL